MPQKSFKMSFNNDNVLLNKELSIRSQLNNSPKFKSVGGLNAPMIDRVYRAKAGCSACGKKAM
jgi:hypothetical protein